MFLGEKNNKIHKPLQAKYKLNRMNLVLQNNPEFHRYNQGFYIKHEASLTFCH